MKNVYEVVNKFKVTISFKWFDFWIGIFFDKTSKVTYICLLPMFPIKIYFEEFWKCPHCDALMQKIAYLDDDGWILDCECKECGYTTEGEYEWPFGDRALNVSQLEDMGFEIV